MNKMSSPRLQFVKKLKYFLKGAATYFPAPLDRFFPRHQHQFFGRGSIRKEDISAKACYSLWLRQLVKLQENGCNVLNFKTAAEIGPGDSVGMGLAALLSGVEKYYGLDVVANALSSQNGILLDELETLFRNRTAIPDDSEFPKAKPKLSSYEFPHWILTDKILENSLIPERLAKVKSSAEALQTDDSPIRYYVPWHKKEVIEAGSVDLIFSVAVMEHIDDLDAAYAACGHWLKPGGIFSAVIDYKSHGTAGLWNEHYTYSDRAWRMVKGRCFYFVNRRVHSEHIGLLKKNGFSIVFDERYYSDNNLPRRRLSHKFRLISEDDLVTSGGFVIARKDL